jgi:hypothetical protein
MKMRLLIALLMLSAICIGNLNAEELAFYQKETDRWWSVFGEAHPKTGQVTCYGRATKNDGSFIQIHRSLIDGEVWAIVHGTEWEIQGGDGGSLRWNFFGGGNTGLVASATFDFALKDKNTILIQQIEPRKFSDALWNARYFTLVMPGNIPNMSMSFESKGASMLTGLTDCVKLNEKKYKNFKPSLEKVPDAVKETL